MKVLGIRWLAGSAVTALALVASAEAAGAASQVEVSPDCDGVSLSVRGARWIQQIDVRVDGQVVSFRWADEPNGESWDSATGRVSLSPGTHAFQWSDDGWDHSEAEVIHWHDGGSFTVPTCGTTTTAPGTTTAPSTTGPATTILVTTTTLAPTTVTEVLSTEVEPLPSLHRPSAVTTSTVVETTVALTTPPTMPVPVAVLDATTSTVYVVPDGVAEIVPTTTAVRLTGRLASTGTNDLFLGLFLGAGTVFLAGGLAFKRAAKRNVNVKKP